MANLTGSPLDQYVQDQIKIRQQFLGHSPELKALEPYRVIHNHNKNAWVRLASSVDLTESNVINELSSYNIPRGPLMAQQLVLIGGITSTYGDVEFPRGGVVPDKKSNEALFQASKYSYGLGSTDYGLSPIPGLGSVSIQHMNRGAIRKFQIKIEAQNKDQFAIIEALYLRLGYYMLLEWGHTHYAADKDTYVTQPLFNTPAFLDFFESGKKDLDVEDKIGDHRRDTGGNYDGALFKVDNFSWSINSDGSYSITLSGVSKGGLIDSLTIGSPRELGKEENQSPFIDYFIINPSPEEKTNILKKLGVHTISEGDLAKVYKETIGRRLSKGDFDKLQKAGAIQLKDPNSVTTPDVLNPSDTFDATDDDVAITILNQNKSVINKELFNITRNLKSKEWVSKKDAKYKKYKLRPELLSSEGMQDLGEALAIKFSNASNADNAAEYNYITLGALLSIIKEKVLNSNNNIPVPISDGYKDNYMFTHWFQHSTDPRVCLIPFDTENNLDQSTFNIDTSTLNTILSTTFREVDGDETPSSPFKGYLMAIHVNIEFISKTLEAAKSNRGGINLYTFLEKLMFGIQDATGNINRFTVTYDETNGINIKDDTIIPGINDQDNDDDVKLRLYGTKLDTGEGSFLRNISAQSKITGKMATQIAIGSTASGNSINSSTSLLARWNNGLVDRLQASEKSTQNTTEAEPNTLLEEINKQYVTQLKFLKDSYEGFQYLGNPSYTSAQTTLKNLLDYDLAVKTINGNIAGKGFIPIDVSLEMDGMSGILLYQKIKTTEEILPASYVNKVDFIVMALDHTITGNEWTTTINTLSVPKRTDLTRNTKGDNEFSLLNPPETGE